MDDIEIVVEEIYVPAKRRLTLKPDIVEALAESIISEGLQMPILVRRDAAKNFVLVEGLHRLEACKALGEETILANIVQARRH